MKCPKCSFASFDFNDACPKCGKDLTPERDLMGHPSYKPKPLSMLAPLNAYNGDISGDMTRNGQSSLAEGAMNDVPDELLISLDDLSDDESEQIQIEPDPTQVEPEQKIDDEISLGDLSDDEPLPIQMESDSTLAEPEQKIDDEIFLGDLSDDEPLPIQTEFDPAQAEPEPKIDDEIFLDLSLPDSEETESRQDNILDTEDVHELVADIEFDDVSEQAPNIFVNEEAPGEAKRKEPMFELELEPLEFDLDMEETDEKTP